VFKGNQNFTGKTMQRKAIDKALLLGVPAFLLALFVLNITAEGEVKLVATLGSVGLCIGFFSHHYLGVILESGNGKGFDFHYPHKEAVIKARLQEVLGDDGFNNVKKNV